MGSRFSCSKQPGPQTSADQKQTKHDPDDDRNRSSCSVLSLLMLVCMWKNEAKEAQLLQAKEKEKEKRKQQEKQRSKAKEVTLEDWLVASPGLQKINGTTSGGEYHVFKNNHSSKRVFPSFVGENANNCSSSSSSSSNARESFSKKRLLVDDEDHHIAVSLSMSQSGKSKKRVSFRLPEEADIFIFHSSSSLTGEESG